MCCCDGTVNKMTADDNNMKKIVNKGIINQLWQNGNQKQLANNICAAVTAGTIIMANNNNNIK